MNKIYAIAYCTKDMDDRLYNALTWVFASNRMEAIGIGYTKVNEEFPLVLGNVLCSLIVQEISDPRISLDNIPTLKITELEDNE